MCRASPYKRETQIYNAAGLRNLGCSLATGSFIVRFGRLKRIRPLKKQQKTLC